MIEIVGQPRDATPEELKEITKPEDKKNRPEWEEAFLRTFLANH